MLTQQNGTELLFNDNVNVAAESLANQLHHKLGYIGLLACDTAWPAWRTLVGPTGKAFGRKGAWRPVVGEELVPIVPKQEIQK